MKSNRPPEARSGASPTVERVPAGPILFIDGHCVLCQRAARWVLRHDRRGRVALAALQGKTAHRLLPPALCEVPAARQKEVADADRNAAPARPVPAFPDRWCGARWTAVSGFGRRRCWPSRRRLAAGTGRPRPCSGWCPRPARRPLPGAGPPPAALVRHHRPLPAACRVPRQPAARLRRRRPGMTGGGSATDMTVAAREGEAATPERALERAS